VCYLLPKYDPDSEEHFFHIYGFLEYLAATADIYLIVERASSAPSLRGMRHVYAQRLGFPLRILETLAAVLVARVRGYRIFYVHYSFVGALCASAVARCSRGRVYYWHCGLASLFFKPWALDREALHAKLAAEIPLRLILRAAHTLVTGTPGMADYYAREFAVPSHRIVVLPNEIDLLRFDAAPPRDVARTRLGVGTGAVVLFLHRLSPRKGAELLPEIIRRVVAARPDVVFLIAGDGPSRPSIERVLTEAALLPHVRLLGWVPNHRVRDLYVAADLFIMPSLEEGFPRVLLEAMASGTPFVASDVGGVREICAAEQQRWLVPPGAPDRVAAAVVEALSRDDLRRTLATLGREQVRRYDTPVIAQMFARRILGQGA